MSKQLVYDDLSQEIIQKLYKIRIGTLATSDGNFVTARQMMLIPEGLNIYCITGTNTRKFEQISINKNVSVVANNIQIDGVANLKGCTSDPKNNGFLKTFEKHSPEAYNNWHDKCLDPNISLQLIEIFTKRIAIYVVKPPTAYLDVLNIDKKTSVRYFFGEDDKYE